MQKQRRTTPSAWQSILPPLQPTALRQNKWGQLYPKAEVAQYVPTANSDTDPGISEDEAEGAIAKAVDTSDVLRLGDGPKVVYAYGYRCAPDRLKIGLTEGDTVQRVAAQISTSTPDKPTLFLEIKTHDCGSLV